MCKEKEEKDDFHLGYELGARDAGRYSYIESCYAWHDGYYFGADEVLEKVRKYFKRNGLNEEKIKEEIAEIMGS